jgi:hypothetical protein
MFHIHLISIAWRQFYTILSHSLGIKQSLGTLNHQTCNVMSVLKKFQIWNILDFWIMNPHLWYMCMYVHFKSVNYIASILIFS